MAAIESLASLHGSQAWSALPGAPQVPFVVPTHNVRAAAARALLVLAHLVEPTFARAHAPEC